VWTPNLNKGKPFPMKKVPVEAWAIGEFRFKGIPGVSKVNAGLHRHRFQQALQTCNVMSCCDCEHSTLCVHVLPKVLTSPVVQGSANVVHATVCVFV